MKMKKIICIIITVLFAIGLGACGEDTDSTGGGNTDINQNNGSYSDHNYNNGYSNDYGDGYDDSSDEVIMAECPLCHGKGECMSCKGTGRIGQYVCGECEGSEECSRCGGDGEIETY